MSEINIHQLIRERFSELPEKLQEAITSTEVAEKLREIATKHRLHLDQGQVLENETYMVLLGIEEAGKYESNLRHELDVSEDDAHTIATEVAEEIFLSVRNELKGRVSTEKESPATALEREVEFRAPTSKETAPTLQKPEEDKFSQIVKRPAQKIDFTTDKANYTVDPYREPVE